MAFNPPGELLPYSPPYPDASFAKFDCGKINAHIRSAAAKLLDLHLQVALQPQVNGDLGTKIWEAITSGFQQGFSKVSHLALDSLPQPWLMNRS